jgi:pimeloyl-ACP methyl ester carboxylesterase
VRKEFESDPVFAHQADAYNPCMTPPASFAKRKVMEWIVLVAAIVLGVPAAAWFAQDRLIFFPQPVASTAHLPADAKALEIVATDGTRLRGWMRAASETPAPVVLYFGGNAEEVSWTLADPRWPRDWAIVAINYRGYGESEGAPGETELVADALVIYDTIAARPDVNAQRIVAFGRSLGTGVAVKLVAARPVDGAILVSPYDSLVELGRTHYPWLPVSLLLRHRFDGDADAQRAHVPLLAIVADHDSIIPQERSRALYNAWAGPKTWFVVLATDHNTLSAPDAFWYFLGGFLAERAQ